MHPANGQAWKDFNLLYLDFTQKPHNIRLGLTSDGFNPFLTMSISHSTQPMVLINYNIEPWKCLKLEYLILSMHIPCLSSPRKDIDVYLQPLVKELKELWTFVLDIYDALSNQSFQWFASLLWIISDFLVYVMLSRWITKGKLDYPNCHYKTYSQYLKHSKKTCYLNYHSFLDMNHPRRFDKKSFNIDVELKTAPTCFLGYDGVMLLFDFENIFQKKQNKQKAKSVNP